MTPKALARRVEDAESVLQRHPAIITVARQFRRRMERAGGATFSERDCEIHDMIISIGEALTASGKLWTREQTHAWYHACGVEAR